jgi:hypothetical protein
MLSAKLFFSKKTTQATLELYSELFWLSLDDRRD